MLRKALALGALCVLGLTLIACTSTTTPSGSTSATPALPAANVASPTKDNPMIVDKQARKILVYAEVNRKWVTDATRHGIVCANGSNADKALFRAGGDALELNKALFEIGGKAGENVKKDSPAGTMTQGDPVTITVSWDGVDHPINDLVVSTGAFGGKALRPAFGGNAELQGIAKTGCIFCFDSCAAGIVSNTAVGWKSFDSGQVEFRGIGDKLPADGTPVVVTFAL